MGPLTAVEATGTAVWQGMARCPGHPSRCAAPPPTALLPSCTPFACFPASCNTPGPQDGDPDDHVRLSAAATALQPALRIARCCAAVVPLPCPPAASCIWALLPAPRTPSLTAPHPTPLPSPSPRRFIKQEAEEKAAEIAVAAEEEFNITRLQLLEAEKARVRREFERREGTIEVKKKV